MRGLFVGLTSIDIIYPLEYFPLEDTKNKTGEEIIDIGGPATNAAFTFRALGGDATLISLLGNTPFSAFIQERLEQYGIRHLDLNPAYTGSPEIASILVNKKNGSRTVATVKPRSGVDFKLPLPELSGFDVICADGFFGRYLLKLLLRNEGSVPVVFDGGSYKTDTDAVLDFVNYPILSERFAFPGKEAVVPRLQAKKIRKIAITRGEKPIRVFVDGSEELLEVPKVTAVDTLGAGDIFHGAFCKYILEDPSDFRKALLRSSGIASHSCKFPGPRRWTDHLPIKDDPYS